MAFDSPSSKFFVNLNGLKWCLTYFTFKLIKIITFYKILSLFFYFIIVNPLFKAINVNDTTISFTFTGNVENIITNLFMLEQILHVGILTF